MAAAEDALAAARWALKAVGLLFTAAPAGGVVGGVGPEGGVGGGGGGGSLPAFAEVSALLDNAVRGQEGVCACLVRGWVGGFLSTRYAGSAGIVGLLERTKSMGVLGVVC